LQNAEQDDPRLIQHIRDHWLIAPPDGTDRNISVIRRGKHKDFSEFGQPSYIENLLNNRSEGFFLECGAFDGTLNSNTLHLELSRSWTGLLVEANPIYFRSLLMKRRRAYLLNACLSPTTRATKLNFTTTGIEGGLLATITMTNQKSQLDRGLFAILHPMILQCFPLFSVLQALNMNHVDYLSLDVEGAEIQVLKTLPLHHVTIDAMTVETRVINDAKASIEKEEDLMRLVSKYGYKNVTRLALDAVLLRQEPVDNM
jgi:FkbM family methyltransferase